MIIWKGYGFLVFVITFLTSLLAEWVTEYYTKNDLYYQENKIPLTFSFIISSFIIYVLGRKLNKGSKLSNNQSINEMMIKKHDFFFIPMEYWSFILCGISFLILIYR